MNYQLVWPDSVISRLAGQYLLARTYGHANAFTFALARIERRLTDDPFAISESRWENVRVTIDPPVTVQFRVETVSARDTVVDVRFALPRTK